MRCPSDWSRDGRFILFSESDLVRTNTRKASNCTFARVCLANAQDMPARKLSRVAPHRAGTLTYKEVAMATQNSIHVSDELLAELQAKAAAEGRTVDELAEEALRKGLGDRAWQHLLEYGRQTGRASCYTEADVPDIVRNRRKTNSQRR